MTTGGSRTVVLGVAAVWLPIAVACSSDDSKAPAAAADVTVRLSDGAEIRFAAGSVATGVDVEGAVLSSAPHAVPKGYSLVGSVYRFTPHGTVFQTPATVRIPVANASGALFFLSDDGDTTWERVPGVSRDGDVFTFQTSHISFFAELVSRRGDGGIGPISDASLNPRDGTARLDAGMPGHAKCGTPKVEWLPDGFSAAFINETGTKAGGGNTVPPSALSVAAMWSATTGIDTAPDASCDFLMAFGPNDVGGYVRCSSAPPARVWTPGVGLSAVPLDLLAGASDDGTVAIGAVREADGSTNTIPAYWSQNDGVVRLPGGTGNTLFANADGTAIVGQVNGEMVRWDKGAQGYAMTSLPGWPSPASGDGIDPYDFSSDGRVIVGNTRRANGEYHAEYWSGGKVVDIGLGIAWAVNADGSAIGGWASKATGPFDPAPNFAFLWDPVHGLRVLEEVIDPTSFGASPVNVIDVSRDGCVIIGSAMAPAGISGSTFRAVLPSPPAELASGHWDAGSIPDL